MARVDRPARSRRGRVHAGRARPDGRVPRARRARPRVARGVLRGHRVGAVRADARTRRTGTPRATPTSPRSRRAPPTAATNDSTATTAEPGGTSATVIDPVGRDFASLIPGGGGNIEAVGLAGAHRPSVWPHRLLVVLIGVLASGLLWIIVVPLARRRQRHNRRKAATDAVGAGARRAGRRPPRRSRSRASHRKARETYREFAQRASTVTPVPRSAMRALADDASAAQFSGDPLPEDVAERAEATVTEIETASARSTPVARKVLGKFDPRPPSAHGRAGRSEREPVAADPPLYAGLDRLGCFAPHRADRAAGSENLTIRLS